MGRKSGLMNSTPHWQNPRATDCPSTKAHRMEVDQKEATVCKHKKHSTTCLSGLPHPGIIIVREHKRNATQHKHLYDGQGLRGDGCRTRLAEQCLAQEPCGISLRVYDHM
jgi:hypothetical protein